MSPKGAPKAPQKGARKRPKRCTFGALFGALLGHFLGTFSGAQSVKSLISPRKTNTFREARGGTKGPFGDTFWAPFGRPKVGPKVVPKADQNAPFVPPLASRKVFVFLGEINDFSFWAPQKVLQKRPGSAQKSAPKVHFLGHFWTPFWGAFWVPF